MLAIVTDSTADLTAAQLQRFRIHVVPLYVVFADKPLRDGLEIQTAQIFERVKAGAKPPSTSQPTPEDFIQAFADALKTSLNVLCICISSKLSGTYQSAVLAAKEFEGKVTVYDSQTVSGGLGMMAIRASQMKEAGKSVAEIVAVLDKVRQANTIHFTVDTLDYLKMNGRIGGAQALLGSLLNIKPMLKVSDGKVEAAGKVRGRSKALEEIKQYIHNYVQQYGASNAIFLATPSAEQTVQDLIAQSQNPQLHVIGTSTIGAVVASHAGPGTLGVCLEPQNP